MDGGGAEKEAGEEGFEEKHGNILDFFDFLFPLVTRLERVGLEEMGDSVCFAVMRMGIWEGTLLLFYI